MNKDRLLWPPLSDELVGAEKVGFSRRGIGRPSEQLALPITVDRNGIIEKLDDYGAAVGRSSEERHSRAVGPP